VSCRFTFDSQNNDSQCTCDREGRLAIFALDILLSASRSPTHLFLLCFHLLSTKSSLGETESGVGSS